MLCTNCQFDNPEGINYCGNCGVALDRTCNACGSQNPGVFKYCGNCGKQLASETTPSSSNKGEELKTEAERRHLTVMFCDLVGSTALSNQMDPEDLREVIREYQEVCQKVVARYEGHIAQYLGDGILVYFGYPRAHENDAHRAVSSGLGILEAIKQFNKHLAKSREISIAVRIGVHSGHVVIGDLGSAGQSQQLALGATPNIAARLEGLALPGTMVISQDTYELVSRFFLCEDKGSHQVKGISRPIQTYQVTHENVARSRYDASQDSAQRVPVIGRDREIAQLIDLWEEARKGKSRVVLLSGEPGVGKSTVLQELMAHVAADSANWLNLHQCSPYHQGNSFYPLAQVIKHIVLKFRDDESTKEKIGRLEGFLLQYGFTLNEMVPLFAGILSIPIDNSSYEPTPFSIEQQRQKIIEGFIKIYLDRSDEQDLLIVFEDLQWIDSATLEIITQLINQPPTSNILTVLTFRTEFVPPWHQQSHVVALPLSNLSDQAVKEIIIKIAGDKQLPEELIDLIIQKTDGVPLFVEELTKMVMASDMVSLIDDRYELKGPISTLSIPSTLHDSLVARLDKMAHTKEIAQLGSVIGREFQYQLVRSASDMDENSLRNCLKELVEAELLLQKGVPPDAIFKFRHALIRDAAYQSLLKRQRQKFHLGIAQSIVRDFPAMAENSPEILAQHFHQAHESDQAIAYWIKAAQNVIRHRAFDETLRYVDNGLSLLEELPSKKRLISEVELLSIKAPTLFITEGFASSDGYESSRRLKELAELLDDQLNVFQALRGIITYDLFSGNPDPALQSAREALLIAKSLKDKDTLMEAYRLIGQSSIYCGELTLSLGSFNKAIDLWEESAQESTGKLIGSDPLVISLCQSSHVAWYLGYPDQARERIMRASRRAEELQRPYGQALCFFMSSIISSHCGDINGIVDSARMCISVSKEFGLTMFENEARIFLGIGLVQSGNIEEGLEFMNSALEKRISNRLLSGIHLHLSNSIATYLNLGNLKEGFKMANKAFELTKQSKDQLFLSEIYRLNAELMMAENGKNGDSKIEEYLNKGLKVAKKQEAKSFELRCAISMARYKASQGQSTVGLKPLKDIYDWFEEGFDTRDLIEAKRIIDGKP